MCACVCYLIVHLARYFVNHLLFVRCVFHVLYLSRFHFCGNEWPAIIGIFEKTNAHQLLALEVAELAAVVCC